jgi:2-polyprenyl-3-methyl-5-hydroxy-6-metoxy-1,4-benzoquinol methylase
MHTNPTIETYDKYAQLYDEEVIDFWNNFPKTFIDKFVTSLPGKRVLNLGSGSGRDALLLREHGLEVVCLDASKSMIEMTTKLGFESHLATFSELSKLDFPADSFDGVWAYTSLIHIPKEEAEEVIKQAQTLLKPKGAFVFGAIQGDTAGMVERETMPGTTRYFKNYNNDELRQFIEPLGFNFLDKVDYKPSGSKTYLSQLYTKAYNYTHGFEKLLSHTNEKEVLDSKIGEFIDKYSVHSLLDIGAGDGSFAKLLASRVVSYTAIEPKAKFAAQLREAGLNVIEQDFPASDIPNREAGYDLVLMSHVISHSLGNHTKLIPSAWELVRPGGHLLIITHGNDEQSDWERLLKHIGFGESEKLPILFTDIITFLEQYSSPETQKVPTAVETDNIDDLVEVLAFVAAGNSASKAESFMAKSDTLKLYLENNYRQGDVYSFPFQHFFVCVEKPEHNS